MARFVRLLCITSLLASAGPVLAQDCSSFGGQDVSPMGPVALRASLAKIAIEKDEFETTEQFQTRLSRTGLARDILAYVAFTPSSTRYDADAQLLKVPRYAIGGGVARYGFTSNGSGADKPSVLNVDIVLQQTTRDLGSYMASNAYGASVAVEKSSRTQLTVWERSGSVGDYGAFPEDRHYEIAAISADPATARIFKSTLRFAVLFTPRTPFVRHYTEHERPKIDDPEDNSNDNTVIVADLKCGLFVNSAGKVIEAISAR